MQKLKLIKYVFIALGPILIGIAIASSFFNAGVFLNAYANESSIPLVYNADDKTEIRIRQFNEVTSSYVFRDKAKFSRGVVTVAEKPLIEAEKYIGVDLHNMKIGLYKNGTLVETLPVLSIGEPGSPWQTPAGIYDIKTKEVNHFSSIGKVWMPNSMQFYGNFFIHGWPYYPDGTPVSQGYSGGCIRLSNTDADKVFNFADLGTPVSVYGELTKNATKKGNYFLRDPKNAKLDASSDAYLVADLDTGEIILERNKDIMMPIASLTKLVTSIISLEYMNQFNMTKVSNDAVETYGESGNLIKGEKIIIRDLIYPLLLESSNDASEVLAEHMGRKRFVKAMNDKAVSIGLRDTSFMDASGLSDGNISTAKDLFLLSQFIYKNKKYIFETTKEKKYETTYYKNTKKHVWRNIIEFAGEDNFLGGKNGYTDAAKQTLIVLFSLPLSEFSERNVAIIILGSYDRKKDAEGILEFLDTHVYFEGREPELSFN